MKNTNRQPTYDYNIYKISVDNVDVFKEFLEERYFRELKLRDELIRDAEGFSFSLMFCDKDNHRGTPWVQLLSKCSEEDLIQDLKIYGAVLICKSDTSCYVILYGNAHFYLSNYCDYNFGIKIAERLVDLNSIKAQQNVSHGGKLSKTHIDYLRGSNLVYRGGEIPTYIKGKSINENEWGESINCGISAQFKWKEGPLEIGKKLKLIDDVLNNNDIVSLPRLIPLNNDTDYDKIESLYKKLSKAIDEYNSDDQSGELVNVPSFYLVGTKLVQNDSIRFKLSCNHKYKKYDGELSIIAIKEFIKDKEIDIYKDIKNIKLSVEYGNDQWTNYKPLTEYLEFVTDDNFCLRGSKWCSFNNAYLEQVMRDVSKVKFINHTDDEWVYSKTDLLKFANENNSIYVSQNYIQYETYYNIKLANYLGAKVIHPETVPIDEDANNRYKYEVCDLILGKSMYFVKIGQPSDFAYAIDQAALTLSKIQNGHGKVKLPNKTMIEPNEFHLVLIYENRKTIVKSWNDIYSINFLIHISDLKQSLDTMNISLIIDFVYDGDIIS